MRDLEIVLCSDLLDLFQPCTIPLVAKALHQWQNQTAIFNLAISFYALHSGNPYASAWFSHVNILTAGSVTALALKHMHRYMRPKTELERKKEEKSCENTWTARYHEALWKMSARLANSNISCCLSSFKYDNFFETSSILEKHFKVGLLETGGWVGEAVVWKTKYPKWS